VVVNAGNANACTGSAGLDAARRTAAETARVLGVQPEEVLVASTGVIGVPLPLDLLLAGLPRAVEQLSIGGGAPASEAILTTDTRAKLARSEVSAGGARYTIGGMAKGSGMIHPNMATTLAFVTTDAAVEREVLDACLRGAVERSFHRVTVDGDTSTNDMVAVLAGGASGVRIDRRRVAAFEAALADVLVHLAKEVARDGEGATRLVEVEVRGAQTDADALQVARTVAGSPLVKTAVHGADANWGRIVAAAGRAGVPISPERLRVWLAGVEVLSRGYVSSFSEEEARARLLEAEVPIVVDLGLGTGGAVVWTCDLSADYVRINASYRS
jgi:glutamate N-acetyltransferase/amino-acid N-acetyltransferase